MPPWTWEPRKGEAGVGAMVVDQALEQHGEPPKTDLDTGGEAVLDQGPDGGNQYGPWMVVQRRHRGRRGGGPVSVAGQGSRRNEGRADCDMWKDGKARDQHVASPIEKQMTRGGRWCLRGGHSSVHRGRFQDLGLYSNPAVEVPQDVMHDNDVIEPLIRDGSGPFETNILSEASGSRRKPGDLLENRDVGEWVDFIGGFGEAERRSAEEKGKGIMVSARASRPLLLTSVDLTRDDCARSPSPAGSLRQSEGGGHNNLVDRIMDALQNRAGEPRDAENSDGTSDRVDSEEEMTLFQYQMESRGGNAARRGVVKVANRAKKGRNNPY